ncbi:MAG: hypothetical protein JOY71_11095 [Acetobacteraceae bacterium]|nr:hypothetical protein [Acetobacteraceae bacterium]
MFDDEAELLDNAEWLEFEKELREAFDQRDGVHFEIVLMRVQNQVVHQTDVEDAPGRLTQ